jgi:phage terminase Nu1 subunit (DNA packaging protein)
VTDIKDIIDISKSCMQRDFASLIGVSEFTISNMIHKGVIKPGEPLGQWLKAYCAHMREVAAGRATTGDLNLATERAALAREQKLRIEMQNAITRQEYGPIAALEIGLSDVAARVAAQLDTIPGRLKIASDKLSADDLDLVAGIVAAIRNDLAAIDIDWFGDTKTEQHGYDGSLEP